MFCEMNRIASHLVWLGTSGLELGAVSVVLYAFREREMLLDIFEIATGLRMNHAYFRIGGVVMDVPPDGERKAREFLKVMPGRIGEYEDLLADTLALGVTGPVLRSAGVARDVRKDEPYSGYETYDFDVVTRDGADCFARFEVRIEEMKQSLRIIGQCLDRLQEPGPVMVEDPKVRWPAELEVGPDGIGNSEAYVKHIMEESMEALI